jgi:SAM-dependent methyltransferase
MSQNIYDQAQFFASYSSLPRSQKGLDGAPEWPTLRAMVGDVRGARILDLGCGFGWVCRWARDEGGAKFVRGLDLSENMIGKAREFDEERGQSGVEIEYGIADLETLSFEGWEKLDVVYSSLVFHYLQDFRRLVKEICGILTNGGRFVFSVEHPIYTAPVACNPELQRVPNMKIGKYKEGAEAGETWSWPLTSYASEGPRERTWFKAEGVKKYHRTIETYLTVLLDEGFVIKAVKEWMPSADTLKEKPVWAGERDRPMFLLVGATKG